MLIFFMDGSFSLGVANYYPFGTSMPFRKGAVHPIKNFASVITHRLFYVRVVLPLFWTRTNNIPSIRRLMNAAPMPMRTAINRPVKRQGFGISHQSLSDAAAYKFSIQLTMKHGVA
jgi:hypothetical protein